MKTKNWLALVNLGFIKNGRYHQYKWQISDLDGLKLKKCPIFGIYFAWLQCGFYKPELDFIRRIKYSADVSTNSLIFLMEKSIFLSIFEVISFWKPKKAANYDAGSSWDFSGNDPYPYPRWTANGFNRYASNLFTPINPFYSVMVHDVLERFQQLQTMESAVLVLHTIARLLLSVCWINLTWLMPLKQVQWDINPKISIFTGERL